MIESRECKNLDFSKFIDREEVCCNIAQFNFINSIREVKSAENHSDQQQELDLDNGVYPNLFKPDSFSIHNQADSVFSKDQPIPYLLSYPLFQLPQKPYSEPLISKK